MCLSELIQILLERNHTHLNGHFIFVGFDVYHINNKKCDYSGAVGRNRVKCFEIIRLRRFYAGLTAAFIHRSSMQKLQKPPEGKRPEMRNGKPAVTRGLADGYYIAAQVHNIEGLRHSVRLWIVQDESC